MALQFGLYQARQGRRVELYAVETRMLSENGKMVEREIYKGWLLPVTSAAEKQAGEWEESLSSDIVARYRTTNLNKSSHLDLTHMIEATPALEVWSGAPSIATPAPMAPPVASLSVDSACPRCAKFEAENQRLLQLLEGLTEFLRPRNLKVRKGPGKKATTEPVHTEQPGE